MADLRKASRATIDYDLGNLDLSCEVQDAIDRGRLTTKHGRALHLLVGLQGKEIDLFVFLLERPNLKGDEALTIARVMKADPRLGPDDAADAVEDPVLRRKLGRVRPGPRSTTFLRLASSASSSTPRCGFTGRPLLPSPSGTS